MLNFQLIHTNVRTWRFSWVVFHPEPLVFEPKIRKKDPYKGYKIDANGDEPAYWHKGVHMKNYGEGSGSNKSKSTKKYS